MKDITKKYSTAELSVIWKPVLCTHCGNCVYGLPNVFNPKVRPWIQPQNSTTQEVIRQVNLCPSGALSYELISK